MSSVNQRPVSHYCLRHKEFGGINVPTLRRVQLQDEVETTKPSSFVNDIISVNVEIDESEGDRGAASQAFTKWRPKFA